MDPLQFSRDYSEIAKKSDIFGEIKLMVRRKIKDTNFKAMISIIIQFFENKNWEFPEWLKNVIVGNAWRPNF